MAKSLLKLKSKSKETSVVSKGIEVALKPITWWRASSTRFLMMTTRQ